MSNRNHYKNHKPTRLERVERKCAIIISELAIIRKSLSNRSRSIDEAIERKHRNTRRMRTEVEKDARILLYCGYSVDVGLVEIISQNKQDKSVQKQYEVEFWGQRFRPTILHSIGFCDSR